jgi:hypothetical protein
MVFLSKNMTVAGRRESCWTFEVVWHRGRRYFGSNASNYGFADSFCHRSELDWHFWEKTIYPSLSAKVERVGAIAGTRESPSRIPA